MMCSSFEVDNRTSAYEDDVRACHFFSWDEKNNSCELGYMKLGWHFNYTDDPEHRKQVFVDTGEVTCWRQTVLF